MSEPTTPRSSSQGQHSRHSRNGSICTQSSSYAEDEHEKSAKKFFSNWKQACDKTKDRTKELLKRTLSWKDTQLDVEDIHMSENGINAKPNRGWSVHVWTTWVKRSMDENETYDSPINLTIVQKEKLEHFFIQLLDYDRDELISVNDFHNLSEKLRHFADWSESSVDFSMLQQVQAGFISEFFYNYTPGAKCILGTMYISLDDWLRQWSTLLGSVNCFSDLPFWLQQLPRTLFSVINKNEMVEYYTRILEYYKIFEISKNNEIKGIRISQRSVDWKVHSGKVGAGMAEVLISSDSTHMS